jgi:hypothetical protein
VENILFQENLRKALTAETENRVTTVRGYGSYLYNLLKVSVNKSVNPAQGHYGPTRNEIEGKLPSILMVLYNSLDTALGIPSYMVDDPVFATVIDNSDLSIVLKTTGNHYLKYQPGTFQLTIDGEAFTVCSHIKTVILLRELYELGRKILTNETNADKLNLHRLRMNPVTVGGKTYYHVLDAVTHHLQIHDSAGQVVMVSNNLMEVYRVEGKTNTLIGVWKIEDTKWVFQFRDTLDVFEGLPVTQIDSRVLSEFNLTPMLIHRKLIG